MNKYIKRLSALLMCAALCLELMPPAAAQGRTVTVASPRDLLTLAKNCVLDTYSQGLTVVLAADLDLTGVAFDPIPVFRGTFDGAGHTVTGFRFAGKGSDQGFFRYLQAGGVVKNLTLSAAELTPGGGRSGLGLLCGQNEGTIADCSVSGTVTGDADVGGVVGVNLAGGRVERCTSAAAVSGNTHTGGIVGRNEGDLTACVNRGPVNIDANESAQDTGGVAGLSTGGLSGCLNYGGVGYQHTGYNTGGIAGRQNGNVVGCENHGFIQGRKDVGGIVGQFEPYTTLAYGEDPMRKLDDELGKLSGLMSRFADQVNDTTGSAVEDLQVINEAMDALRGVTSGALDDGADDIRRATDQIYDSAQTINSALGTLLDHVEDFSADASDALDGINASMDDIRDSLDKGFAALDGDFADVYNLLDWDLDRLDSYGKDVTTQLDRIGKDIGTLETFARNTSDILQSDAGLLDQLEAIGREAEKLGNINIKTWIQNIGKDLNGMATVAGDLREDLADLLDEAGDDANAMWKKANAAADRLSGFAGQLNESFRRFGDQSTDDLRIVNGAVGDIETVLRDYRDTVGDKGGTAVDDADRQLQTIGDQLDRMNAGAADSSTALHDTTGDIIRQLDAIRDAITDLGQTPEKKVDDVSDRVEQEGDRGRVVSCANDGAVSADANVGGIAGTVSPELSLDPEEDLDLEGSKLLVDTTAYIKATVRDCKNAGAVTAKNDCAGGVVGRAEVGAVLDSLNTGAVEAASGAHCGGVAGLSRGTVRRSHALCALTGHDQVGGVAGEGHDLRDCYAMVTIDADGERLGAIAGSADGEVKNCVFVRESLAGIDGVDYEGKAAPLDYADFQALPGLPEEFLGFTITFVAEGRTLKRLDVAYGGSLDLGQVPAVPERTGMYGRWSDFPTAHITRSRTVEAVYSPWVTAIASKEAQPSLLMEGAFPPNAYLAVMDYAPDSVPAGYDCAGGYSYAVAGLGDFDPGPLTLRIRWEGEEEAAAALVEDGVLTMVETVREGSYLCLAAPASASVVLLVKPAAAPTALWAALAAAVLLVVVLFLHRRKKRKKTQKTAAAV